VRINGQDVSVTRPTKKEAEREALAIKMGFREARKAPRNLNLTEAIDKYIEARSAILSPSTIRGYRIVQRNRFQSVMRVNLSTMTDEKWQRAANQESRTYSAKTIKNSWGFIASVVEDATGKRPKITIKPVQPTDEPWLTPEEINVFCEALRGDSCEIPALLALSSLRRSEILGLTWENIDLKNSQIKVRGAIVPDENNHLIHKKENKTVTSTRTIPFIIPQLRDALEDTKRVSEFVCTMHPDTMRNRVNHICAAQGLPEVGLHGLRRSFASLCYHLGISEAVCMQIGGWSDIYTMRKIYIKLSQQDVHDQASRFQHFFSAGEAAGEASQG
jgi:integrase